MSADTDLASRRRRAKFRASHRGIKEMDILIGGYAASAVDSMDEAALVRFEAFMELHDRDLIQWFTGELPFPAGEDSSVFDAICAHHGIVRS